MGSESNTDLHYWITRGMVRRQGLNLNDMLSEGVLTRGDVAEMVVRCRDCPGMKGCLSFLSEHSERADATPDWCRNAGLFSELRALR